MRRGIPRQGVSSASDVGAVRTRRRRHPVWDMLFTGRTKKQTAAALSGLGWRKRFSHGTAR